jgi:4-amino-4-deoxy-L-arabinose transferase-like glycosyltransferase
MHDLVLMHKPVDDKRRMARIKRHEAKHLPIPMNRDSGRKKALCTIIATLVLAGVPFGLGKYIEFNSPDPFDSGAYTYSAKQVLDGARIGFQTMPSAQVGTLLVNMAGVRLFGYSQTGPKVMQMLLQMAALTLMFYAIGKLFGKLAAAVSVIVASIYLSAPLISKFGNVKEQHMIAFMVMAVSCFVLRQAGGKWWWAVAAGAALVWAPLFKQTGLSAMAAVGLFVLIQPVLKHRSLKQTAADIVLLLAGAIIGLGPIFLWLTRARAGLGFWPYYFLWNPLISSLTNPDKSVPPAEHKAAVLMADKSAPPKADSSQPPHAKQRQSILGKFLPGYITQSWSMLKSQQKKEVVLRILRYYRLLILPIALAGGAIIIRLVRLIMRIIGRLPDEAVKSYERFVPLFAVWWLLDMGFVAVSPRSYEQYYLPLNASAAMLGGYLVALYADAFTQSRHKTAWLTTGVVAVFSMILMCWHIFFGISTSPHSGLKYPAIQRGYAQRLQEAVQHHQGYVACWEIAGEYIRRHSSAADTIYVWGWYPGIYVRAQRFSTVPRAFESEMHTRTPQDLAEQGRMILRAFEKTPPKFIVDSRQRHYPYDGRPQLELWPVCPKGFLGNAQAGFLSGDDKRISQFDAAWQQKLAREVDADEARRYEVMKPLRAYVMNNYEIVQPVEQFWPHIVFQLKK